MQKVRNEGEKLKSRIKTKLFPVNEDEEDQDTSKNLTNNKFFKSSDGDEALPIQALPSTQEETK